MTSSSAPAADRSRHEAKRNIYFFRADAGADEAGNPVVVDFPGLLTILRQLPFRTANGRYFEQSDGNVLCGWVDEPNGQISRMRFALIRKNALPQSESGGELRDLLLEDHEGICETTHVCIFPEGVVGVEFNFFGPRPQRLGNYLRRVVGGPLFTMEALIRQDMAEQLMRKRAIRRMTLRVRRSAIDQVEEANASLGDALRTAEQASGAECVGIILEPDPHQKTVLRTSVLEAARRLMQLPGARTNFRQFQVDAIEEGVPGVTTLNLLEDKLIKQVAILRQHERSRVLQTEDAYQKIESAFAELRQDLLSAVSVNIQGEEGR